MHRACWSGNAKLSSAFQPGQCATICSRRHGFRFCIRSEHDAAFWKHGQPVRLPKKANHSDVHVFGVEHQVIMTDPANFILEHKPATVVFENSFSAAGGNGAIVSCSNSASQDGSPLGRSICYTAAKLSEVPNLLQHPWWQEAGAALDVELLAHVAAFVVGAQVVHADRPVHDEALRLYDCASLQDWDAAVGVQACINYGDMVGHSLQHADTSAASVVHQIHITERDALICTALEQAATQQSGCVVGVVGKAHMKGIWDFWAAGSCAQFVGEQLQSQALHLVPAERSPYIEGARRALFERFFQLSASAHTSATMQQSLPALPAEAMKAYELAAEIYGSHRMLLACLCRQDLAKVCSGFECDMWEVLAPVRAVRPVNGGIGYDTDVAVELRQLMFELPNDDESTDEDIDLPVDWVE